MQKTEKKEYNTEKKEYNEENLLLAYSNYTRAELANMFGVSQSTIYRDLMKHGKAAKRGKIGRPLKLKEKL